MTPGTDTDNFEGMERVAMGEVPVTASEIGAIPEIFSTSTSFPTPGFVSM